MLRGTSDLLYPMKHDINISLYFVGRDSYKMQQRFGEECKGTTLVHRSTAPENKKGNVAGDKMTRMY
jgi:hypothetical protein